MSADSPTIARSRRRFGSTVHRPVRGLLTPTTDPVSGSETVATAGIEADEVGAPDASADQFVAADGVDADEPAVAAVDELGFRADDNRPEDRASDQASDRATAPEPVRSADRPVVPAVGWLETGVPIELTGPRPASEPADRQPNGHRRRRVLGAAAAVVLVGAGVGIGVTVANSGSDSAPGAAPGAATSTPSTGISVSAPSVQPTGADVPASSSAQLTQLTGWISANLSRSAAIVADPRTAGILRGNGFSHVIPDETLAGVSRASVDYLVSVPGADTQSTERNQLAESSAHLAVFSTGPSADSVAQVFADGADDVSRREAENRTARNLAGTQLPNNPNVTFLGSTKEVVASGAVDLRATTALVVLAQQSRVWVRAIAVDPAEARAGLPARSLTITVADGQTAQSVLMQLPALYRPRTMTAVSQGTLQVRWSPAVAPVVSAQ